MRGHEMQDMKKIARAVLSEAQKGGAEQAAARLSRSRFVEAAFRDGAMEKSSSATRRKLTLRLFLKGRFAVHTTSDLGAGALRSFVQKAAELTRALEPDPMRGLPDPGRYAKPPAPDLAIFDGEIAHAQAPQWIGLARRMEELARRAGEDVGPRLVSAQGRAYAETVFSLLADTNGFLGVQEETAAFAGCSLALMDPGQKGKRRMGWWWEGERRLAPLQNQDRLRAMARQGAQRALGQMGAKPGPSGNFPLLVENRAGGRLVGWLLQALSGRALHNKRSYLAGKLGQSVAGELFNLTDQPLMAGGLASRWFDAEGMAAKPLTLVEKGVLNNYYLNTYYSRTLKLPPTTGSSSNVVIAPTGDQGFEGLMGTMKKGLAVRSFLGGNFNSTTGDFSLGVQGLWVQDGQPVQAVESMNLSGNFNDFWRSLAEVGNDPYPYAALRSPSLLFQQASLSGA